MARYCTGTKDDKNAIVAFINGVFHENFYDIMKKTYAEEQHYEPFHHLIKENDGRIVAALGVYEQTYHSKNEIIEPLKTGFIGSVSVDKNERGKGYMKVLMEKAEKQMRKDGVSFAMLGGFRNRYGYWGYELGGIYYQYHFREENIYHTIGWDYDNGVVIRPVEKACFNSIDFEQTLDRIYYLYRQGNMWCRSREEFYLCCLTWNHKLYEIIVDNTFAGYVVCNRDGGFIPEIELIKWDREFLLRVLRGLMRHNPISLETDKIFEDGKSQATEAIHGLIIQAHAWEPEKACALQQVCEHYFVHTRCNVKILDYPKTLKFMLQHKKTYTNIPLEEKQFVVSVNGKGTFVMMIKEGNVDVWQDDNAEADLIVSEKDCISALMSSVSNLYERKTVNGYPKGWFPLEFAPGNLDEF